MGGQAAHDDDNGQVKVSLKMRWRPAGSESTWILNVQQCKKCMTNLKDFLFLFLQQQLRKREEWKSYSFDHRCGKATSFTRHLLLVDNFTSSERIKSGSTYNVTNGKRLNSTSRNEWNFLLLCSRIVVFIIIVHLKVFSCCCCSCANCEKMRFLSPRASCCSSAAACHCVSEGLRTRKKAARNGAATRRNKISVFFMVTFKRLSRSMMGLLEINIHFSFTLLSRSTSAFSLQRENC